MPDYTSLIAQLGPQSGESPQPVPSTSPLPSSMPSAPPVASLASPAPANDDDGLTPTPAAAGGATLPADGNPYASIIGQVDQARAQAAQTALYGARDADPDKAGQAAALQPQIGGASTVIEKNLPAYQAQAQALQNGQILQANPALADWVSNNPLAPRVAKDDLSNLSDVSSWAQQWSQGWSEAINSNALARLYAQGAAADPARVASLEATMQAGANSPAASGVVHFLATIAGGLADTVSHAAPLAAAGAVTGAAVGATAAGLPTAATLAPVGAAAGATAGAGAGFETGMWLDGYRTNAGTVMHALDGVRDADGNPVDPNAKAVAGFVAGVVGGTLNLVGLGAAGRVVGTGLSDLLSDGLAQAVTRPGVGAALSHAAVNIAKGGLTGAGLGALTESTNVLSQQIAQIASPGQFETILNDPQQRQQAVDDIASSAATMALQLGVMHGVGALPPLIADSLRARRATDDLGALQGMMQTASDSKVQSRAPSLFETWVQQQTEGGRGETLFAPGDAVQELYQSRGITPGPDDGLFGQFIPDIKDQLEQARMTGGDVVMPTAGFVAHMAGTEEAARLMPHIRVGEDGMSAVDVDAYTAAHADSLQARGDEMQQSYEAEKAGAAPVQAIHDDVLSQARAAGFAPDTAEQYASLLAARYASRGERMGEDPLALYKSEGVQIRGPESDAIQTKAPDNLDVLLNAVRSDRPEETDRALFGPSLMEFLAKRGGVEDPGGDFAAMGAADWHRGQPGMRRFIRPPRDQGAALPGMNSGDNRYTPDAATLAAHEAGYLPESDRPDINTLHDAVRRELSGDKVYTGAGTRQAAEYRDAVRDLSDTLDQLGIDPKTASNAEIRSALKRHAGGDVDGDLRVFDQKSGEPAARITGEEIAPHDADLTTLRQAASEFYRANLQGRAVRNPDLGEISFTGRGLSKARSSSANPLKLRLFAALEQVIKNGKVVASGTNEATARKPNVARYHWIEAPVRVGSATHLLRVNIEERNGHFYYNHTLPDQTYFQDAGRDDQAGSPSRPGVPSSEDRQSSDAVDLAEDIGSRPPIEKLGGQRDDVNRDEPEPIDAFRDTARKAGPQSADGGGATYNQKLGGPADDINMDVRDFEQPDGSLGAQPAPEPNASADASILRGSIRLSDGSAVISLFAKRDLSTVLHEAGHLFLDELSRDAGDERAPQQVRDDMAAVREWLSAEPDAALSVSQHEKFARGFEAYLMEGRAPSEALRSAFRRFRAWLVGIYRSVAGLRVDMSPEMRDVFDRLLASDDEIDRAREDQRLGGLFKSAADAGMTDAEFRAYTEAVERARGRAVDGLTGKVMNDVRRERMAWWKHQEEPIREDVQSEVDKRPEMRALGLFRSGRLAGRDGQPGERIKLDRQGIVDLYGTPAVLDMLPKRVPPIYGEGGVDPDMVASMVGARNGDALLKALLAHEATRQELRSRGDKRSVRAYTIDTETHARMVERHGEVLTDGSLQSEALDQVHGARQLDVLSAELRALGRRTKAEPTPVRVARQWADRTIAAKSIKDARPGIYLRAEAKAGRAAERALLAGDHAEAFRAKQQQLLNHALYMSAKAAKDDIEVGMRRMERFGAKAEFPTTAPDFVDRVHELLRRFSMPIKRDSAELDRALGGVSLQSWATERLSNGFEIYIAPELYDPTYARPVDELNVAQFRDLADSVKSIAHAGRDLQQVTVDGEKSERADIVAQMVSTMSGMRQKPADDFVNQGGESGVKGVAQRAGKGVAAFHAMLLKPETIIDTLDGRDPNGIFNRAVWRPIKAAQGMENDLLREVTGQLKAVHDGLGKGYGRDFDKQLPDQPGITDPRTGTPMALKRRGLIGIALNVGNESNLQRLVDGYGWSPEAVQALLDRHMTEADWRFVQGAWDTFEGLFPRIEAMQRRLTGVGLEKIVARDVETPFGSFRGGYYPVIYDPNLSTLGDRIQAQGEQRFEVDYVRATTQKGHTISRLQQVREPLSLDPDGMAWKLRQSVHDLAYREAIINADKLLRDRDVIFGMEGTIGRDQRKQLDRWLQGVANDQNVDTRGLAAMDGFLHRLRTNATVVGIGFRASTMLKHGSTALSNSIGELGPKWMLQGSREFFGSPDKMRRQYQFVTGASAEMRNRMNEIDRDVRDALRDATGKSGIVPSIVRFSHYGVAMLDMGSALPTWMGAYRKAQAQGMEEPDAVAYADKTVRNAHGANGAPDLAAIQRGTEAQKLLTMFYGFFNHVFNRQVVGAQSAVSGVRNLRAGHFGAARGDFAHSLATFFFYLAMPALIEAAVSEGLPSADQDAEGWMAWMLKAVGGEAAAGIPVLRDIASAATHGRSYSMSPTGQAFDTFEALAKDVGSATGLRNAPVSDRWLQHAVTAPGYVFGLPTGQAAGTAQFLSDVAGGEESPQSMGDWARGLTFGPTAKRTVR